MNEDRITVDDVQIEEPVTEMQDEKPITDDDVAILKTDSAILNSDREWKDKVSAREVSAREVSAREVSAREVSAREVLARDDVKERPTAWLSAEEIDDLKSRWNSVQTEFVDDPHASIKQADDLVSEAVERFQQALHKQRTELVEKWSNKEDVSTEDLRVGLQNYRSFLDRLLTMKTTSS